MALEFSPVWRPQVRPEFVEFERYGRRCVLEVLRALNDARLPTKGSGRTVDEGGISVGKYFLCLKELFGQSSACLIEFEVPGDPIWEGSVEVGEEDTNLILDVF